MGVGGWGRLSVSATKRRCPWSNERGWSRDHWELLLELRGVRSSRDGELARRERVGSPRGSRSLGSREKKRGEGSTKRTAEREMRPGVAPGPGLKALRTAVAAIRAAGPRFARVAPSDPTSSSTAPFSPRCRMSAVGFGPRGLAPGARGPCLSSWRPQFLFRGPGAASRPPLAPSTLSKPRCFGCLPVGGAGASEHFLIAACHRFCSTRAPGRSHCLRGRPSPTGPSVCAVVAIPAHPRVVSP